LSNPVITIPAEATATLSLPSIPAIATSPALAAAQLAVTEQSLSLLQIHAVPLLALMVWYADPLTRIVTHVSLATTVPLPLESMATIPSLTVVDLSPSLWLVLASVSLIAAPSMTSATHLVTPERLTATMTSTLALTAAVR